MKRLRLTRPPRRAAYFSAGILFVLWLLTAYRSPINPILIRWASRHQGDITWSVQRAGLYGGPHRLRVDDLQLRAPGLGEVKAESIQIGYRILPLVTGRVSLRSIAITGFSYAGVIDPESKVEHKAVTVPESKAENEAVIEPESEVARPALPAALDLKRPPTVDIRPLAISMTILDPPSDAPLRIDITNGFIVAKMHPSASRQPPYAFQFEAQAVVNQGNTADIKIAGQLDPATLETNALNLDADVALTDLALTDVTATGSTRFPFIAEQGKLHLDLNLCARDGRLSGLASMRIQDMVIRQNPNAENARFLTLTFNAWHFLARQHNGRVEAEADIGGSVLQPIVPLGQVLQHQAGQIGRGLTTRMLDAIPLEATREQAEQITERREAKARHDDILKIARLPEYERHFERGRHYERIVRAYPNALSEYQLQVERYPAHTNLVVQALMHGARLRFQHMKEADAALADLRRILDNHPLHDAADEALYEMIRITESQRDYQHTARLCDEFLTRFPDSPHGRQVIKTKERIRRFVW
jgi:hypothetical protein